MPAGDIRGYPAESDAKVLLLGSTFNALVELIVSNGLAVNPGVPFVRTRGGVVLKGALDGTTALVRTTASIPGRTGTAPGTTTGNNAVFVSLVNNTLTDGAPLKLYNLTGGDLGSGKYGLAFRTAGVWWGLTEC